MVQRQSTEGDVGRRWPTLEKQLAAVHAPPGSTLARVIATPEFVELIAASAVVAECLIEFESRNGGKMRIQWMGSGHRIGTSSRRTFSQSTVSRRTLSAGRLFMTALAGRTPSRTNLGFR
jgi:hypothetical protein